MDFTQGLGLAMLGGSVGLGAYCLTCALHVWGRRNAGVDRHSGGLARKLRRVATVLLVLGLGTMVAAIAIQLAVGREGVLRGDQLYTVRLPKDLELETLTENERVGLGSVLARFRSPEREAEIAVLRLRRDTLQAEREIVATKALAADAEITRRLQDVSAEHRHLELTLHDLGLEKARLAREQSRDRTAKQDEISRLQETLDGLGSELEQARARLALSHRRLERSRQLLERRSISADEHSERVSEAEVDAAEVARLEGRLEHVARQKAELEQGLRELIALADRQSEVLASDLSRVQRQLAGLASRGRDLESQLADDQTRAEERRRKELEQIDVQLRQTAEELAGLTNGQVISAPFDGRVVYRAASPRTVFGDGPLMVVSPGESIRLRVRVRTSEVAPLKAAETVRLELVENHQKEDAPDLGLVERKFSGRLVEWKPLPDDPFFALAELACEPPAEAIRAMASGHEVRARLAWFPSPLAIPEFLAGAVLSTLGLVVRLLAGRGATRPALQPAAGESADAKQPIMTEYGAEGAMLHLLGTQLRESITQGRLDPHLIAAAEWALDRHRARAVRLLSAGMGTGADLYDGLGNCVEEVLSAAPSDGGETASIQALQRLLNVLRVLAPEPFLSDVERWQRRLAKREATLRDLLENSAETDAELECPTSTEIAVNVAR